MASPSWFASLQWSAPVGVEALRGARHRLPAQSGVYVFTNYSGALAPNTGVLYVGKAKSLASRVASYLVDPAGMQVMSTRSGTERLNTSLRHAGKVQLLVELQQKSRAGGPSGLWVRWLISASPAALEASLIGYLRPAFNTQGRDRD